MISPESPGTSPTGAERMRSWAYALPEQIREAAVQARRLGWSRTEPVRAVFVGGMGGSGMAGRVAAALLHDRAGTVPLQVQTDPALPGWVQPGDLCVIVTYSGETWEARQLLREAIARGATVRVVASGGPLREEAEALGVPVFLVPEGYAPRAALGWMSVPVLLVAAPADATVELERELSTAADSLEAEVGLWAQGRALPGRDPSVLAAGLSNRLTYLLAASERMRPVSLRWKCQLQENAKQAAVEAAFPEAVHNEVEGWGFAAPRSAVFLLLEDPDSAGGHRGRVAEAARAELARCRAEVVSVPSPDGPPARRILGQILLADVTSLEVARRRGIDPLPVEAIGRIKAACGKERLA